EVHVAHPMLFKDYSALQCEALATGDFSVLNELPPCIEFKNLEDNNPLYPLVAQLHFNGITNVLVNFGLYKDLTYYNGAYFDIVSRSFGKVIGSGGRYDSVLNAFNVSAHAVGFAFRLHYIERALAS
ncbi:MAG: ATP phosphoribosyltransferase regulatory subunit, partial [Candidatus Marinamargulisbacteria bacterium]